jgi:phthalate 4,5-dioxygenase oxygenase subunit
MFPRSCDRLALEVEERRMLSKADNDRLTQVETQAPMGKLIRERCWIPFARGESLTGTTPPQKVRLLGEDFIAFRAADGRVGFVDERCPHRGASLALARVEGCSLRCIFHGWRIEASGSVVEVPSEAERSAQFASKVRVNRYPTREAGGMVWVFLGEQPPEFPDLPFMAVPPQSRWVSRTVVSCNWLQGLEGALDSSHLGWLHQSWIQSVGTNDGAKFSIAPVYETHETRYGMRAAAIRHLPDGQSSFLRISEYLMPFTVMNRTDRAGSQGTEFACFMAVPVDNQTHLLFWCIWNQGAPLADVVSFAKGDCDLNDYARFRGTKQDNWGQDRAAMDAGHFSGFPQLLLQEDVVVQISMGAIADRSREQLCATDLAIAKARHHLLELLKLAAAGESVAGALGAYRTEGVLPFVGVVPKGFDWVSQTV